ncbi:hypothetical protein ABTI98_19130, partial [Acinetobacter baumannii]
HAGEHSRHRLYRHLRRVRAPPPHGFERSSGVAAAGLAVPAPGILSIQIHVVLLHVRGGAAGAAFGSAAAQAAERAQG